MSNPQHTPGPYSAHYAGDDHSMGWDVEGEGPGGILFRRRMSEKIAKAWAKRLNDAVAGPIAERNRLKAINADLLAALKALKAMMAGDWDGEGVYAMADAALAKATGADTTVEGAT